MEEKIKVKVLNCSGYPFEFKGLNAGIDLYNVGGIIVLHPGDRVSVSTGIHLELPAGSYGDVKGRSGLCFKHGIVVCQDGTVDRGYTGEIKVPLVNIGREDYVINQGDRVAQLVITMCYDESNSELIEVSELSESERGEKGFGSSGK